jgi:c-di-GMP-binding flagellar brake protein YcgR
MVIIPEERRRFPRVELHTPIRYQVRGTPEFDSALTENISLGGASFIGNKFIAPQTTIMLELSLLSRLLRPIAKIAWSSNIPHSNRIQMGVEFLELDPNEKNYLQDYMNMQTGQII